QRWSGRAGASGVKFGPIPVLGAQGALLAHSVSAGTARLRKARRLTSDDIEQLMAAGVETVIAAVLDEGDLDEDAAASRIAAALEGPEIEVRAASTGRVNVHALSAGVFTVDKAKVDALNAVDP